MLRTLKQAWYSGSEDPVGKIVRHPDRQDVLRVNLSEVPRHVQRNGQGKTAAELAEECLLEIPEEAFVDLDMRVMEEALTRPESIPDSWKRAITYFQGTVLHNFVGCPSTAYIYFRDGSWHWSKALSPGAEKAVEGKVPEYLN